MMDISLLPRRNKLNLNLILVGAFFFSLALRLIKLMIDPLLMRDSANYLYQIEGWFECNSYIEIFELEQNVVPPFALWIIKAFMKFGFGSEVTGRALNLFASSLIPIVCILLTYKIFKKALISVIAFFLCACHPKLMNYSIQPLRDNFNILFVGLFFLFIIDAAQTNKIKSWWNAGIASAFAVFSRYESMELILISGVLTIVLCLKDKNSIYKHLCSFLLYIVSFCISFYIIKLMVGCDLSFIFKIKHYIE